MINRYRKIKNKKVKPMICINNCHFNNCHVYRDVNKKNNKDILDKLFKFFQYF